MFLCRNNHKSMTTSLLKTEKNEQKLSYRYYLSNKNKARAHAIKVLTQIRRKLIFAYNNVNQP